MEGALRALGTAVGLILRLALIGLIPLSLLGFNIYRSSQLSRDHAEREVEERGMTADRERKYGPIQMRVPSGFRRIALLSMPFDDDPMHWTGRGALVTLRLGQYKAGEEYEFFALRYAAELRVWIPAPGTAGPPIQVDDDRDGSVWPSGPPQTTSVSNDAGVVATLHAPASLYSTEAANRILSAVVASVRIDDDRMQRRVAQFIAAYDEEHAPVVALEDRLAREFGVVFAAPRPDASNASEVHQDRDLRDGLSPSGVFTHDQGIYFLCRTTRDLSNLGNLADHLATVARAYETQDDSSYHHGRVVIAAWRRDRRMEMRLIWRSPRRADESETAYGSADSQLRRHRDAIERLATPDADNGARIYVANDMYNFVDAGDVLTANDFLDDAKRACSAPEDASSAPTSGLTLQLAVEEPPPAPWIPWYDRTPPPQSLSAVLAIDRGRRERGSLGYLMVASGELCEAMRAAQLACDYDTRYALVQFLLVNGKPIRGIDAMYSYTGKPIENRRLTDAIQRNLPLFQDDLTAEEVRHLWQ